MYAMALPKHTCKECGWQCKSCEDQSGLHLHVEIENLKQRLLEREHHIVSMETNFLNEAEKFPNGEFSALTEELLTWQEKYSRLYESHKRVQKVNQSLEDKLLRLVDKSETEKNSLTRDLRSVSQRLVEARSKIKQLEDENERYRNDVNLAIQLLQCKPMNFVSQKIDSLSPELQHQVRTYVNSKRPDTNNSGTPKMEPKIIKVPIPTFPPTAMVYSLNKAAPGDKDDNSGNCKQPVDIVSAAIMAKILEERARERLLIKHCPTCTCSSQAHRGTDCATQTSSDRDDISKYTNNFANLGNQGFVRCIDVVGTRNEFIRNVTSLDRNTDVFYRDFAESPKDSNLSRNISYDASSPLLGGAGVTRNIESMKLNDASLLMSNEISNRPSENSSRNGKFNTLPAESVPRNGNIKLLRKTNDMSSWPNVSEEISLNMQDEALWSSLSSASGSPISNQVNIDMESPVSEVLLSAPVKSNRDVFYGKLDENKRLQSYLGKSETVRARNRESRTFLSDEMNNVAKEGYKVALSPNNTALPKPPDAPDSSAGKTGLGTAQRKVRLSNEKSGPRPCSLRMQAGTSNILLANATCYTPVLYTSRPDVLVHSARPRSMSASSTDTGTTSSPDA